MSHIQTTIFNIAAPAVINVLCLVCVVHLGMKSASVASQVCKSELTAALKQNKEGLYGHLFPFKYNQSIVRHVSKLVSNLSMGTHRVHNHIHSQYFQK